MKNCGKAKFDYSKVFGEKLVNLAKENKNIVAVTAAMTDGTGLREFANNFPERIFDVGIAEQHAVGFAAGLAKAGMIPVVPMYSSFIQRAFDQLVHDVAILDLPVVICSDRSGIVGQDGETHQGLLDMAFTNIIPNFTIMAPKDFKELENMLEFAVNLKKPTLIRYPRGAEEICFNQQDKIELGKCEVLQKGKEVCLIAIGKFASKAYKIAEQLENQGIHTTVINSRFLKPIDEDTMMEFMKKAQIVVTLEDASIKCGLGSEIEKLAFVHKLNVEILKIGYPDEFVKQGTVEEIEEKYGLDNKSIMDMIILMKEQLNLHRRGNGCLKILEKSKKKQMKESY